MRSSLKSIAAMGVALTLPISLAYAEPGTGHHHGGHAGAASEEPHLMGHGAQKFYMYDGAVSPSADYAREVARYETPAVILRDRKGAPVDLAALLGEPRPVAMQFIFTSCATVCPVLSAGFAQAHEGMAKLAPETRLISISIDPEYDTPPRLDAYAERYGAPKDWIFLTGSLADIRRVIFAFDALLQSDNKTYHRPYTYLRGRPGADWVRLEGMLSRAALLREYEEALRDRTARLEASE